MQHFKSYVGKQVMLQSSIFVFASEVIETDDHAVIEALSKAADVDCVDEDGNVIDSPKLPEKSSGESGSKEQKESPEVKTSK